MMYLTFLMITVLLLNLSSYCSIDSWISLHIIQIYVYIIRQCYKRRSCLNFKRTTAYYRFKSWLYCHANNHCRCHPPRHKHFYLRLNVSMITKWQENLCCSPSIPGLNIMALLIHRQMTLPQYHSRQRWRATNAFAIVQRCYFRVLHLLYRQNQDIHSLALRIQR